MLIIPVVLLACIAYLVYEDMRPVWDEVMREGE